MDETEEELAELEKYKSPARLTPEVRAKLLQFVKNGATYTNAARMAGIIPDTFTKCMKRANVELKVCDRSGEEPCEISLWVLQIYAARATYLESIKADAVGAVKENPMAWGAVIQILEKEDAAQWGHRQNIDVKQETKVTFELVRKGIDGKVTSVIEDDIVEGRFIEE